MEKVYRLLRNNLETGPFTIEELRQQKLMSSDLVWVDGECRCWLSPTEFDQWQQSRKPGVQEKTTSPEPKANNTSIHQKTSFAPSVNDQWYVSEEMQLERRAEELRTQVLTTAASCIFDKPNRSTARIINSTPVLSEDMDDIEIVYHRKENTITASHLIAACLIGLVCYGGWRNGWAPVKTRDDVVTSVALPYQPELPKASPVVQFSTELWASSNRQEGLTDVASVEGADAVDEVRKYKVAAKQIVQVSNAAKIEADSAPEPVIVKEQVLVETGTAMDSEMVSKTETAVNEQLKGEEPEKKKGIGQVIKGLFKKKNKKINEEEEQQQISTAS